MPLLQYQQLSGPGLIPAIDALPAFRRIGHGGYGGLNPYLTHSIGQLSPSDAPFCAAAEFLALPLLPGGRFRCLLSPCDPSRNRTAPLPTKPRQTIRNRTGTLFVGGRRQQSRRGDDRRVVCDASFYVLPTPLTILIWSGPARTVSRHTGQVLIHLISASSLRIHQQVRRLNLWIARRAQVRVINRLAC